MLPPLQLQEGPQGAGTQGRGSHSAGADALEAWRIDPAEQELGPLRRGSQGGTGGTGRSRKLEPTTASSMRGCCWGDAGKQQVNGKEQALLVPPLPRASLTLVSPLSKTQWKPDREGEFADSWPWDPKAASRKVV